MSTGDPFKPNFPDGSLTKIVYKDFLTYVDATVYPGPNLNLIVGFNGTGKSSIICGICIAVGGNPKSLGRSEKLCDYIKRDCETGSVEVYIADAKNGEQRVEARLKRPNTVEYYLNGGKVTQSKIKQMAEHYNIQVDNPCAFLAQDKVKSFSEQSAIDLLNNTEKAGDESLYDRHQDLIKRKKEEVNLDNEIRRCETRMQNINDKEKFLIPRVENFKKKQSMKGRIQLLNQRKTILYFTETQEEFKKQQRLTTSSKKKLAAARAEVEQHSNELHELSKGLVETRRSNDKWDVEFKSLNRSVEQRVDADTYESQIVSVDTQYQQFREQCRSHKQRVEMARSDVQNLEEKCQHSPAELEECKERWANVTRKSDALIKAEQGIDHKERILADGIRSNRLQIRDLEQKKDTVMSSVNAKTRPLSSLMPGAYEAWRFVEENANLFRYPVYCPLIHLSTQNDDASRYLENIIPNRDLSLFVFGCGEDESIVVRKFKINSTVVDSRDIDPVSFNTQMPENMKELGFRCFASQLFTAPDPLKHYLCKVSHLNSIPIGSAKTNSMYNEVVRVLRQLRLGLWFTDSQRCSFKISKYSGETISNTSAMRPIYFLKLLSLPIPDATQINNDIVKLTNEVNSKIRELEQFKAEKQALEADRTKLRSEMEEIKRQRSSILALEERIKLEKERLRKLENKPMSLVDAKKARDEGRATAVREFQARVKKIVVDMKRLKDISVKLEIGRLFLANVAPVQADLDQKLRMAKVELHGTEGDYQKCVSTSRSLQHQLDKACEELFESCGIRCDPSKPMKTSDNEKLEALQKEFEDNNIPNKIEKIVEALGEENAKLDMISKDGSQADVVELEKLRKEREELGRELAENRENRDKRDENMRKAIHDWITPVEQLIKKVNENFSSFLREINCDGEVHLDQPENDLDVDKYGIVINVSFRKGERLKRLDGHVQSGGERSVSTMFYLLSLQEVCPVPFRCVDEINQGMDPTNERKVFEIMVNKLGGSGNLAKTQYFLLTPKLLHDLPYNEKVTVQIVHNSHFLPDDSSEWDPRRFASIIHQRAVNEAAY